MAKIEIRDIPSTQLEAGDIILVANSQAFWVIENGNIYMLVDVEDMKIIAGGLNHPTHVINHVKKHYSTKFRIVKNEQIKVVLGTRDE